MTARSSDWRRALLESLRSNRTLEQFDISFNRIGATALRALASVLSGNKSLTAIAAGDLAAIVGFLSTPATEEGLVSDRRHFRLLGGEWG
jgi:Ran GTPase-activating protein (RanGAP) involved in mRNA processing and transport